MIRTACAGVPRGARLLTCPHRGHRVGGEPTVYSQITGDALCAHRNNLCKPRVGNISPQIARRAALAPPHGGADAWTAKHQTLCVLVSLRRLLRPMEIERPIATLKATGEGLTFSREERERHVYIVGKSGSGKTTTLFNLAMGDIVAGEGVAIIDPHGDLAEVDELIAARLTVSLALPFLVRDRDIMLGCRAVETRR